MSYMSDLDQQLREAGIDPESVGVEEALSILAGQDALEVMNTECSFCECPEAGVVAADAQDWEVLVVYCWAPCMLAMSEEEAVDSLMESCD